MAYATVDDVQARSIRTLSEIEKSKCATLLDDAAVMIDAAAADASSDIKKVVSCRMVIRAIGDGQPGGYPVGASQGSMSGLGYSQSWTVSSGGSVGELYLSKADKKMLGVGNSIGSYSPVEEMVNVRDYSNTL